jgi:hypothetical protein
MGRKEETSLGGRFGSFGSSLGFLGSLSVLSNNLSDLVGSASAVNHQLEAAKIIEGVLCLLSLQSLGPVSCVPLGLSVLSNESLSNVWVLGSARDGDCDGGQNQTLDREENTELALGGGDENSVLISNIHNHDQSASSGSSVDQCNAANLNKLLEN